MGRSRVNRAPHDVFVELDELYMTENGEMEWKETARWIKFEEDVEEGGRWGKPHVASLSFHSLLELRRCIEFGVLLFDVDSKDLTFIVNAVVDKMVSSNILNENCRGQITSSLLLKHRHMGSGNRNQGMVISNNVGLPRNVSSISMPERTSVGNFDNDAKNQRSPAEEAGYRSSISVPLTKVPEVKVTMNDGVARRPTPLNRNQSTTSLLGAASGILSSQSAAIMKRIPNNAECCDVLVGCVDFLDEPVMAFVRLAEGTVMDQITEVPIPVRFLFFLLGPPDYNLDYHEVGRSISTLMSDVFFHEAIYRADTREDLLSAVNEFLDDSIVLPAGEWDRDLLLPITRQETRKNLIRRRTTRRINRDQERQALGKPLILRDPLERTGRLFGGLLQDVKQRYPWYLSDILDFFNIQSFIALFFIYFTCFCPAITYGGLLGDKTNGWMGISEMLISTSLCGILFGLFSCQPLLILGPTGPVLIFEEAFYKMAKTLDVSEFYMQYRLWTGVWVFILCSSVIAFDGSFMVRYVTRFTEEIFAFLISFIFIYEVVHWLQELYKHHPLVDPSEYCNLTFSEELTHSYSLPHYAGGDVSSEELFQPNTALLSTILCFGTFLIALFLREFRKSRFLGKNVRRLLGDFGIPISMFIMVLVDYMVKDTYTRKLKVPENLFPTIEMNGDGSHRNFFIDPIYGDKGGTVPWYMVLVMVVPGMLVFVLLFMETEITEMIINQKHNKIRKGTGHFMDMFLVGALVLICSLFGLPWMCAATYRCITHVGALSIMTKTHAPGEKPMLIRVIEQRVTSVMTHVFIGASLLLRPLLIEIPYAVLFGIFLYLGMRSLSGIQLIERIKIIFMAPKHHPDRLYIRKVRLWKIHLFTFIQVLCVGAQVAVKMTIITIAFPFFLLLLIPLRKFILPYFFSRTELAELDTTDEVSDSGDEFNDVRMPM